MRKAALSLVLALALAPAASGWAKPKAAALPETTGVAAHAMVAAANPLAVEAGLKVLRRGGSAVDAAVAVQTVLGLVEPQSSGLGGGAFMVFYDARTKKVTAYDGREMAPAGATPDMFMKAPGKAMSFPEAVLSGRSTGTPGAIAMLAMAQKDHGALPWNSLFDDPIRLASDGFIVSPRLGGLIASGGAPESTAPDVVAYFTKPDGTKYAAGDRLKNPAYAATLRLIARDGAKGILGGKVAQDIVDRLAQGPIPGTMTLADLAAYQPRRSEALCRPLRAYVLCTPPAPSGGIGMQEAVGILAHTDIDKHANDARGWFLLAEASRLAYADRDKYVGDPAFVSVPTKGLLDPAYLEQRARLIGDTAMTPPEAGKPAGAGAPGPDHTKEPGGTTHFVIVDAKGNVVSMTTTVESLFGSGRMVDGFFLNNQLTDFSFTPTDSDGAPAANAVGPHKRPRSSMTPTIIFDAKGNLVGAVGSPGGSAIQAYVTKAITGTLFWNMTMQQAIDLPNLVAKGAMFGGEVGKFAPGVVDGLDKMGMTVRPNPAAEGSGLHGFLVRKGGGYAGGADPRREGVAKGY